MRVGDQKLTIDLEWLYRESSSDWVNFCSRLPTYSALHTAKTARGQTSDIRNQLYILRYSPSLFITQSVYRFWYCACHKSPMIDLVGALHTELTLSDQYTRSTFVAALINILAGNPDNAWWLKIDIMASCNRLSRYAHLTIRAQGHYIYTYCSGFLYMYNRKAQKHQLLVWVTFILEIPDAK